MARTAAILILAILGHGLFMASSADATAEPHAASDAGRSTSTGPSLDWPAHDGSCFTVQAAVKSAPLPPPPDRSVAPLTGRLAGDIPLTQTTIEPPHYPPNVVRALLQVYRI